VLRGLAVYAGCLTVLGTPLFRVTPAIFVAGSFSEASCNAFSRHLQGRPIARRREHFAKGRTQEGASNRPGPEGTPCQPVAIALRATKGDEDARQLRVFSTKLGKACRGATSDESGPDGAETSRGAVR
jgi:hypothetical protein